MLQSEMMEQNQNQMEQPVQAQPTINVEEIVAKAEQAAVEKALHAIKIESEVRAFADQLRRENEDMAPLEPFVVAKVEAQMGQLIRGGELKELADYAAKYKEILANEMAKAREVVQQLRAAGKEDALQVKKEVVASTPVEPQAKQEEPKEPEIPDYFAVRLGRFRASRGLHQ